MVSVLASLSDDQGSNHAKVYIFVKLLLKRTKMAGPFKENLKLFPKKFFKSFELPFAKNFKDYLSRNVLVIYFRFSHLELLNK